MTEQLHFHLSLSCIGEGNGNPLLCSCLENPRDGGAWWAAVQGVAQSQTRLKRLSSSSNILVSDAMYFLSLQVRLKILCAFQFDLLITSLYEESSWYKAHKDTKILHQIVTRLLLGREKHSLPILRIGETK